MKRLLSIMVVLIILLSACGDYEGIVIEKKDSSFILEVPTDEPEEPIVHEMHPTDGTIFRGSISTFEELEKGDKVQVIPFRVPDDFSAILPSEVIVE